MKLGWMAALAAVAVLGGCAGAKGMGHGAMNHEQMMRHCKMMEENQGDGAAAHANHDPARHGGMNHEDMVRHCAEMRAGAGEATPPHQK
jgi:hypothetical protein